MNVYRLKTTERDSESASCLDDLGIELIHRLVVQRGLQGRERISDDTSAMKLGHTRNLQRNRRGKREGGTKADMLEWKIEKVNSPKQLGSALPASCSCLLPSGQ